MEIMAKYNAEHADRGAGRSNELAGQLKVGKVEYFEKFSGVGRILQKDASTISFYSWRATYPVKEGDIVKYRLKMGPLGLQAVDVANAGGI